MRRITVFDFDGTLVGTDSFVAFAKYVVGVRRAYGVMLRNGIWLVGMKMGMIDSGKVKERIFGQLYKGMKASRFEEECEGFGVYLHKYDKKEVVEECKRHCEMGDAVYIVTASCNRWVRSWSREMGLEVIGTEEKYEGDVVSGKFATANCRGREKVRRLREKEPQIGESYLTVYGDSRGDRELMEIADERHWIK